jgi:hypothetical protein
MSSIAAAAVVTAGAKLATGTDAGAAAGAAAGTAAEGCAPGILPRNGVTSTEAINLGCRNGLSGSR